MFHRLRLGRTALFSLVLLHSLNANAQALDKPELECNGKLKKMTAPSQERSSIGRGGTPRDAIQAAVENAVLDAIWETYTCGKCYQLLSDPYTCLHVVKKNHQLSPPEVYTGGAYLKDQQNSCKRIGRVRDRSWECSGTVVIPDIDPPSAELGCDTCIDCDIGIAEALL